uniref:Uncharacterized protein n=1 Tax=Gadus morhua TaxID=8049 RepID=A0A8C5A146_GADMO
TGSRAGIIKRLEAFKVSGWFVCLPEVCSILWCCIKNELRHNFSRLRIYGLYIYPAKGIDAGGPTVELVPEGFGRPCCHLLGLMQRFNVNWTYERTGFMKGND